MPKAGIVTAIIRMGKISGNAFFKNEYTTSPRGDVKSLLSTDSITQRKMLNKPTFVKGSKKPCGKGFSVLDYSCI